MPPARPLTELEHTVLGVVWSRQPCTPYQVRREFTESPSPYWSGSAGAIYPVMARLEAGRLLRSQAHATGSRKSRLYRVTPAGRAVLVRWIGPPIPADVVGVPPDPLRTRIAFSTVLPAARRRRFLEEVEARLAEFVGVSERSYAEGRFVNAYFELMARGAVAMQRTRLEWIRGAVATLRDGATAWQKERKGVRRARRGAASSPGRKSVSRKARAKKRRSDR